MSATALPLLVAGPDAFDVSEEVECPQGHHCFSASQIETFLMCPRKWAWSHVARVYGPQNASAKVGDRVHHQLEDYLDGKPLDFTEVVNGVKIGDVCASGIQFLPEPCEPAAANETKEESRARHAHRGMRIEGSFRWQSASTNYVYTGRKDLELDDSGGIPGLAEEHGLALLPGTMRTGVPAVLDHKSTSGLRWAKTPEDLKWDVQANLYAYDLMASRHTGVADLVWVYYQTKGARASKRVHLRVHHAHAKRAFALIQGIAREMALIRDRAPVQSNAPRDGIEGPPDMGDEYRATNAAYVRSLSPNPNACSAFGGCAFQHACGLTPDDRMRALMSGNDDELFDSLKKRAAAQDAGKPVSTPAPVVSAPPPPAAEPLPAWATSDVDPMTLRKSKPATSAPSPAPFSSINPPESAIPPPVAPPPAPRQEPEKASTDTDAPAKRKPGRPRKVKDAPLLSLEERAKSDVTGAVTSEELTKLVADAKAPEPVAGGETCTIPGDAFEPCVEALPEPEAIVPPLPHRTAPSSRTEELLARGLITNDRSYFLFVDCVPISGGYENVDHYIAKGQEMIREATAGTDEPVADYRFIGYGKGPGALALAVAQAVDEARPSGLFLSTSSPEGCAVLAVLSAKASLVVRGLR